MTRKQPKSFWAAILMAILCLGVAAHFCGKIVTQELQYKQGDDVYEKISDLVKDNPKAKQEDSSDVASEEDLSIYAVDLTALQQMNPDVKAWITCPDTVIDYPVCQGEDNTYYLRHLADQTYNVNGCLFIDCANKADFTDDNTIIYGHHMNSGKMFASLVKYKEQSYYDAHPCMYLTVDQTVYKLEIFSSYVTDRYSSAYTRSCDNALEFSKWLKEISEKSDFTAHQMEISLSDRIVTLSTCAYDFQNARYVVHGRIVKK